jgi:hypothetical protein
MIMEDGEPRFPIEETDVYFFKLVLLQPFRTHRALSSAFISRVMMKRRRRIG